MIKFCVVGASSTIIDQGIFWMLMSAFPDFPWWVSKSIAFVFGVTNGFIWNRLWTFKSNEHAAMSKQYPKFVATNVVGLLLTLLISKGFLILLTGGRLVHDASKDKVVIQIASILAIPLVVIWNFSASHFWTFKTPTPSGTNATQE